LKGKFDEKEASVTRGREEASNKPFKFIEWIIGWNKSQEEKARGKGAIVAMINIVRLT
jgi:hypothetical protein